MAVYSSAIGSFIIGRSPIGVLPVVSLSAGAQILPSAIGCFSIGASPIASGGTCSSDLVNDALCQVIPSFLYWQYRDDDNLQAFVDAFNTSAQQFIKWFCDLNLPIYTHDPVSGALLDWVGAGLYGYPRPVLGRGRQTLHGPYNTWRFNTQRFNSRRLVGNFQRERVSDDLYRRMLTWHFYKGDGRVFNTRNLKRKIIRFLTGANGEGLNSPSTYAVSISYGLCRQINITLRRTVARRVRGARFNTFRYNTTRFDELIVTVSVIGSQFALATQFKEAVEQGVLELPFQYSYQITVQ